MKVQTSLLPYGFLSGILFLNIFIFFHDPLKYSGAPKCLDFPCRTYSLMAAFLTLLLDLFLAISLTHTNPLPFVPTYWYIPFAIIAAMVIWLHYNESRIVVKDRDFHPPPEFFVKKPVRIATRAIILGFYLLLLTSRLATETQSTIPTQPFFQRTIFNKFGGLQGGNTIPFFLAYVAFMLLIPLASFRLYQDITYHAGDYHLPPSWNY